MRDWLRRHQTLVDTLAVAPFLVLYVIWLPGYIGTEDSGGPSARWHVGATLALLLPLAVRRRFPVAVFAIIGSVALLQVVLELGLIAADLAVVAALFTVAAHCRLGWALAALATVELGLLLMLVRSPYADWSDWDAFASYTFLLLLCWVTGLYTRTRRRYLLGLEERAQGLERERDARAQAAIAEERARIAREMHDVVAHNLSVMVVQADGATFAIDADPARAKAAVETVAATGRAALAEMRGILGVLREGGNEGEYAPRPGVDQLEELIERVRRAGLAVEFTAEGTQRHVPPGVGLAVYRVVQEALTNTLKHAGPHVGRVEVRLYYGEEALEVRVTDDGRGAASRDSAARGQGHGLIGMGERVSAYGGCVQAGPRAGGGYEVAASLPLTELST